MIGFTSFSVALGMFLLASPSLSLSGAFGDDVCVVGADAITPSCPLPTDAPLFPFCIEFHILIIVKNKNT
jgi:hypothetical protein